MWLTAKTHTAETVHCKINVTKFGNCQVTRNQGQLKTFDPLKQMFGFTETPLNSGNTFMFVLKYS